MPNKTASKPGSSRLQFTSHLNRLYSRQKESVMTDELKTDTGSNMGAYEIPNLSLFRQRCTKKATEPTIFD